jgi:hypothetical protein
MAWRLLGAAWLIQRQKAALLMAASDSQVAARNTPSALAADSFPSTRLWCARRLLILVAAAGVINRRVSVYCTANWGGRHYFMTKGSGAEVPPLSLLCACAPRERVLQTGHNFAGARTLWVKEKHEPSRARLELCQIFLARWLNVYCKHSEWAYPNHNSNIAVSRFMYLTLVSSFSFSQLVSGASK